MNLVWTDLEVKQVLAERRAYLDSLYPPKDHKSD